MCGYKTKTEGGMKLHKKNKHDIGGQVEGNYDDKSNTYESSENDSDEYCNHPRNVCSGPHDLPGDEHLVWCWAKASKCFCDSGCSSLCNVCEECKPLSDPASDPNESEADSNKEFIYPKKKKRKIKKK